MKTFKKILTLTATFFSGMVLTSLWFTKSDNWEIYLPIVLACITLKMVLDEDK